ncbi:teichuronic acid exporter [Chryseobacterium sp. SLBN-27]|uniref:lipopolysaccharide biosynthesis protein n=1 Tax=Chryseobacterium sp. SLBN-27 TaxID=3042287 RepID=UPI0028585F6C|nr:lipopolysaccharide biosynthesis protein [Chryseobacterium sp. SLBN-27]MDR6157746.1 teichuronic acid exporter [Chryseobacterium sp. SLBN-27]
MFNKILKSQTFTSLFWVSVEKFGYSGVYFISTIVLARLLTPADFGLIGVLAIFISFSQMIVESGLGGALVKKKHAVKEDFNTIFTFNLACSCILYVILFFAAPFIAEFYKNPQLTILTRVVALNIIISGFCLTQKVHLIRDLKFKKQTIISIAALFISILISISLAYYGFGVWALISQQLSYNVFFCVFIFKVVKYNPKIEFHKKSFNELYGFGSKIFASSLLIVIFNEGVSSLIAKIYSLLITGFYYQAKKLVDFPINIFRALGDSIVFPLLSKISDQKEFENKSSLLMKLILIISFPLFIILFEFSDEVVFIVLGKQWTKSAEMLNILCLSSVGLIIDTVSRNILKSTGNGNAILQSEVLKKIVGIIIVVAAINFNLKIFLFSIVIANLLGCIINMIYVNKITSYKLKKQIKDILPVIFIAIISGFVARKIIMLFSLSYMANFIAGSILILFIYLILGLVFLLDKQTILKLKSKLKLN